MRTKTFMTMAAAALMLAACSNDNEVDNGPVEIRLSSGLDVQTRANSADVPDKQIAENEIVYAWVDKAGVADGHVKAWALNADGAGNFNGATYYYPADGSNLDFFAMHGNFTEAFKEGSTDFPTSAITHTVAADQSGDKLGDNYLKSDLLYGLVKNTANRKGAVNLTFYHLLSKVEVALKSGTGNPNLSDVTVTIENTRLKASFTPSRTADINNATAGTAQAARAGLVTCPTEDNPNTSSISIATKITEDEFGTGTTYAAAIIVPQTVAQNAPFIKVVLSNGGTFYYKIPDNGGMKFESGKKYQYKITVNQSALEVESSIAEWSPVEKTGEATMD